jgi:hypothetical protein
MIHLIIKLLIIDYDKTRLTEKITTIEINTTKKIDQLNLDFLFDYKIFPDNIKTWQNDLWENLSQETFTYDENNNILNNTIMRLGANTGSKQRRLI